MPFNFNANIEDVNDAIKALVDDAIASATSPLSARATTLEQDVTALKSRVTALENETPPTDPDPEPEPEPTPDPEPEPEPEPEPTPTYAISSGAPVWTTSGVTFDGKVSGVTQGTRIQLRVDTKALTGQRGFYEYEFTTSADGAVVLTLADYSTPQAKLYWHLAVGGSELEYGDVFASGEVLEPVTEPTPDPEPAPTPTGDMTGGSGGAKTDRTFQSYSSNGISSQYHIYAAGLDWTKKVGILVYGDGSGEYGLKNPTQTYLMGGSTGLIAVAKKHNLLLVTPMAPGDGCTDGDGVCWYANSYNGVTTAQKIKWSYDLVQYIYTQYDLDKSRVVIGGYSSGAQWTSRFFIPQYGPQIMSDGLFVPIAYGGAPNSTPSFPASFKQNVVGSWDTGTADSAYSTASYGAIGGYNWYTNNGFTTDYRWPSGVGHGRSGEFGSIMDREITQHVKSA